MGLAVVFVAWPAPARAAEGQAGSIHEPYALGRCAACHTPHGAAGSGLTMQSVNELCLSCHEDIGIALESAAANAGGSRHKPIDEPKGCLSCHEPHRSRNQHLLKEAYPTAFYAPYDSKGYALCFSCHPRSNFEEASVAGVGINGDQLRAQGIATGFRDGRLNLHFKHVDKEYKGRTCSVCHDPHASPQPRLIRRSVGFGEWDLPIIFTATPDGGTCTSGCHQPISYRR